MNIAQNPNSELSHFAVNTPQVFEIPETFRETARQFQEAMMQYSCAIREFKTKLEVLNDELSMRNARNPIEMIKARVKKPKSIVEKLQRRGLPLSIESMESNLDDIAGVRVICSFVDDIYEISRMLERQDDVTIIAIKDYIKAPKENGYRSYHIIIRYPLSTALGPKEVFAEIQIRTNAMNFWATAEHSLRYKYSGNIPQELQDRLHNCAEAAFHLDQEMSTIREEITNAQRLNEIRRKMTSNILDNIQKLHFMLNLEDMSAINKEFSDVWNSNDIDKLREFNERLNVLVEVYRI